MYQCQRRSFYIVLCSMVCLLLFFSTSISVSAQTVTYNTATDATLALRNAMKQRDTQVTVAMPYSTYQEGMASTLYEKAIAHTGKGDEGDFLKWQSPGWSCQVIKIGDIVEYQYTLQYLDNAEQVAELDILLPKIEASLNIASDASDYTKFLTIYDYICKNITYSAQENATTRTAYHAITEKEAVCQGYATLLYRMLLDYGIENRIVVSSTHAWNLVKLDGLYYEADSTWDATYTQKNQPYRYMLLADLHDSIQGDTEHVWSKTELDATLYQYKRATKDYVIAKDENTTARYALADTATFVLTASTLYGEYDNGSTIQRGYYTGTKPAVVAINWNTLKPMRQGKDYKLSVKKKGAKATITITGMGDYKGKVSFLFPTKMVSPTITKVKKASSTSVKVSWNKVDNATGYILYRKTNGGKWVRIAKLSSSTKTYRDTKRTKGNTYRYRVKTYYKTYTSGYSKAKSIKF